MLDTTNRFQCEAFELVDELQPLIAGNGKCKECSYCDRYTPNGHDNYCANNQCGHLYGAHE